MTDFERLKEQSIREWTDLTGGTRAVITLGTASCGRAAGAMAVRRSIEEALAKHGVEARILEVGCIGSCYLEPMVDVTLPGGPRFSYGNVQPAWAERIVASHFLEGKPLASKVVGHFGRDAIEGIPGFFDLPMFAPQVRIVLKNCGFIDPENLHHSIANGGYAGLHKALQKPPGDVISEVEAAGLRGRGGAGFPTGRKWRFCSEAEGEMKYVICNADEGDPGALMNRSLIEGDPHAVLEGMLIAGYAIVASRG
jgi:NADH-quinone oxidoreductase subunit F